MAERERKEQENEQQIKEQREQAKHGCKEQRAFKSHAKTNTTSTYETIDTHSTSVHRKFYLAYLARVLGRVAEELAVAAGALVHHRALLVVVPRALVRLRVGLRARRHRHCGRTEDEDEGRIRRGSGRIRRKKALRLRFPLDT